MQSSVPSSYLNPEFRPNSLTLISLECSFIYEVNGTIVGIWHLIKVIECVRLSLCYYAGFLFCFHVLIVFIFSFYVFMHSVS